LVVLPAVVLTVFGFGLLAFSLFVDGVL
jgi:hypothetical protein